MRFVSSRLTSLLALSMMLLSSFAFTSPVEIQFASYFGPRTSDFSDIATDPQGNLYILTSSASTDVPVKNAFQPFNRGFEDVVLAKINSSTGKIIYSTYIGGTDNDYGTAVAVDEAGNAYVVGITRSADFPVTADGVQKKDGSFLSIFSPTGKLKRSTYLQFVPGVRNGGVRDIALDSDANIYIASNGQAGIKTFHPLLEDDGCEARDAFVAKLDTKTLLPVFSTCLGSEGVETVQAIAVDDHANIHLAGHTYRSFGHFPTTAGAFQRNPGGKFDIFVAKINPDQSKLIYSTLLGGKKNDSLAGMAITKRGRVILAGDTISTDFPTKNALEPTSTHGAGFITELNSSGTDLIFSTYIGVTSEPLPDCCATHQFHGIALDPAENIVISGSTNYPNFFGINSGLLPSLDAFLVVLNPRATSIKHVSFFGGSDTEWEVEPVVNASGDVYLAGWTASNDLPVKKSVQPSISDSTRDAWFAKFTLDLSR
jgi:hypothetical protein